MGVKKGDIVYYARALVRVNIYEVYELKVRTVEDDYFCGTELHSKQAFLFNKKELGKKVFTNREDALELVKEMEAKYRKDDINED